MMNDMRLLKLGKRLFLALALLSVSSCRDSTPPPMEVCILDGFGGGDCVEPDGTKLYKSPSAMKNHWATNQPAMQGFSAWCYDTSLPVAAAAMGKIASDIHR